MNHLAATEPTRVNHMARAWEATAQATGVRPDLGRVWDGVAAFHRRSAETVKDAFAQLGQPA